ncbi:MAG: metallopeptidase family protein [Candidatus Levybacteria bacterium]|nr:metallopeptidase family protein [Candidatus Levybacteria bacterium]
MDEERFRELVEEAIDSLPTEFAEKLNNVAVIVEDTPSPMQIRKLGLRSLTLLLGLYEGIPQTKRGHYSGVLPDKITIFKSSIEMIARTEEEIKEKVRDTVIHEIGHHFGLSDKDLDKNRVE